MKVSIITACFNSAATIRDAIDSVLGQSYTNIEFIVVDGASTDETVDIVREYDNAVAKIISEPDGGIYDAMNKGIKAATGEIIGILNSDDLYASPHVISDVVANFRKYNDTNVVFGDLVYVSSADLKTVTRFYSSRKFRPWKLRFGYMPPHPATFVKRDLYERFGLYSLQYEIAADYEMFVRWLVVEKVAYRRIDKVLIRMRTGGVSTSGIASSIVLNREIIKACVDNGLHTNWLFLLPKIPFKLSELVRRPKVGYE